MQVELPTAATSPQQSSYVVSPPSAFTDNIFYIPAPVSTSELITTSEEIIVENSAASSPPAPHHSTPGTNNEKSFEADFSLRKFGSVALGQWLALWYKSLFSYYIHGLKFILLQLSAPFIVLLIVFAIIVAITNGINTCDSAQRMNSQRLNSTTSVLTSCTQFASRQELPCYTLAYFSNTAFGDQIVEQLITSNKVKREEVMEFQTEEELYTSLLSQYNRYMVGVSFNSTTTTPTNVEYSIFYNSAKTAPMRIGVRTIPSTALDLQMLIDYQILQQQHPALSSISLKNIQDVTASTNLLAMTSMVEVPFIAFTSPIIFHIMFCFFWFFNFYFIGKEKKVKQQLLSIGLRPSLYMIVMNLNFFFTLLLLIVVILFVGYVCTELYLFKHNNALYLALTLLVYGLYWMAFTQLFSTFFSNEKAGLIIFTVVNILQGLVLAVFSNIYTVWLVYFLVPQLYWILNFYPLFQFNKVILGMTAAIFNAVNFNGYFTWEMFTQDIFQLWFPLPIVVDNSNSFTKFVNSPLGSLIILLLQTLILVVLTWYWENVLFLKHPLYFICQPSYYGCCSPNVNSKLTKLKHYMNSHSSEQEILINESVSQEIQKAVTPSGTLLMDERNLIRIINTHKTYCGCRGQVKALQGVSFVVERGSCLCLLGENGSGKSTLVSILVGLIRSTNPQFATLNTNSIFTFGKALEYHMQGIRQIVGICPQQNILFTNMTAWQNLMVFGMMKGLLFSKLKESIVSSLKEVGLFEVRNKQVGKFSGGMKRKLQIAVALLGDPQILYFDEFSSGLDVSSRRQICELLQRVKKNRMLLLTTHVMQEADLLADKIVIMSKGKVKVVGSAKALKQQVGFSIKLKIVMKDNSSTMHQNIMRVFPNCRVLLMTENELVYELPNEERERVLAFINAAQPLEPNLKHWEISKISLEQIFSHFTEKSTKA